MNQNKQKVFISEQQFDYNVIIKQEDTSKNIVLTDDELAQFIKDYMGESRHHYVATNQERKERVRFMDDGYIKFYPTFILDQAIIEFEESSEHYDDLIQAVNDVALFKHSFATRNSALAGHEIEGWNVIKDSIYENLEIKDFVFDILDYYNYEITPDTEQILLGHFIKSCPNQIPGGEWIHTHQKKRMKY